MNFFRPAPADRLTDLLYRSHSGLDCSCLVAGTGHSLLTNLVLADPEDLNLHVRGKRVHVGGEALFRDLLTSEVVSIKVQPDLIFEVASSYSTEIPLLMFARSQQSAEAADENFFKAAMIAARHGRWSMVRTAQWLELVDKVRDGALLPVGGETLPRGLTWVLDRPIFRSGQEDIFAQWKLVQDAAADKQTTEPVLSLVTDAEGNIPRKVEQVLLRVIKGSVEGHRPRVEVRESSTPSRVQYGEPSPAPVSSPAVANPISAAETISVPIRTEDHSSAADDGLDYPIPAKSHDGSQRVIPFDANRKQRA